MATRRILDVVFDHGAQFIAVREPFFQKIVDQWIAQGNAKEWAKGFSFPTAIVLFPAGIPRLYLRRG
ncbi:MAG: hypothetical protein KAR05_04220 [Candidatus Omnitrophica bacterium]|nr:hypothetical protein [Candidatus Omnitrophota bacterium]